MSNYSQIHDKLRKFIRKFYVNEIIRGSILFLSLGLIYFLITLFIEHSLWLDTPGRTVLFWLFILTELFLLARFVIIPFLKLLGLKKGIGEDEASRIIGKHFQEVEDKLLNIVQLKGENISTDLLEASIEQKAEQLKPIPFRRAVRFKTNVKYLCEKAKKMPTLKTIVYGIGYLSYFHLQKHVGAARPARNGLRLDCYR